MKNIFRILFFTLCSMLILGNCYAYVNEVDLSADTGAGNWINSENAMSGLVGTCADASQFGYLGGPGELAISDGESRTISTTRCNPSYDQAGLALFVSPANEPQCLNIVSISIYNGRNTYQVSSYNCNSDMQPPTVKIDSNNYVAQIILHNPAPSNK